MKKSEKIIEVAGIEIDISKSKKKPKSMKIPSISSQIKTARSTNKLSKMIVSIEKSALKDHFSKRLSKTIDSQLAKSEVFQNTIQKLIINIINNLKKQSDLKRTK